MFTSTCLISCALVISAVQSCEHCNRCLRGTWSKWLPVSFHRWWSALLSQTLAHCRASMAFRVTFLVTTNDNTYSQRKSPKSWRYVRHNLGELLQALLMKFAYVNGPLGGSSSGWKSGRYVADGACRRTCAWSFHPGRISYHNNTIICLNY